MTAGRPTTYSEAMNELAIDYLENFKETYNDAIPSLAGLAGVLGVAKSTIYVWRDTHPEFSDTLQHIIDAQERVALNNGITGVFNSTITKLVLANHGYHDKVDQEVTGKGGGPVEWNLIPVKPNGD